MKTFPPPVPSLSKLASSGIRQNHASLDLSYLFLALAAVSWLIHGFIPVRAAPLVTGVVLLLLLGLMIYLRRLSIQARFKPRFFSLRQFETMIQVADTMIDTDGENALHPIEVAIRADHFLASFDAQVQQEIKSTLVIVEWLLPLLVHQLAQALYAIELARGVLGFGDAV